MTTSTVMTTVVSLLGRENPLRNSFFPPLEGEWEIGLLSLHTRNVVPNIMKKNNMFYYVLTDGGVNFIEIAEGYYNLHNLAHFINAHLMNAHSDYFKKLTPKQMASLGYGLIKLDWNSSIERVELTCGFPVQFTGDRSLMSALGFEGHALISMKINIAERAMSFYPDNIVRINCSGVLGGYQNDRRSRTIYQIDCDRRPGERYTERPNMVTYFPVCDKTSLREVRVEICDKDNKPINLLRELTLVRLHLRHANRI